MMTDTLTLAQLNAEEAKIKLQIDAVELICKSVISRLNDELDAVSDARIAIWDREIAEFDAEQERKLAA